MHTSWTSGIPDILSYMAIAKFTQVFHGHGVWLGAEAQC
jgi:hypothetical protein